MGLTALIETVHEIEEKYKSSLRSYLLRGDEESLLQAYELSREAIASGLGVLEILEMHQEMLNSLLLGLPLPLDYETVMQHSYDYFREVLSPFEMVHRGFREASATAEDLSRALQVERRALANALRAKDTESALRKSEDRFRFLVEGTQAILLTTNARGLISYVNDAAAKLFGLTKKEIAGRFYLQFVAPEDRARVHEHFNLQLSLHRQKTYIEFRYGGTALKQGWISCFVHPVFDRNTVIGLTAIGQDITLRKLGEEAMSRCAEIIESSDDAIIGKTLTGIITSWNSGAEKIFGYTAADAIGKPMLMIVPPDRVNEEQEILHHIAHGERVYPLETIRMTSGGTFINVSVTISPIKDARGTVIGASTIARDISERVQLEKERTALLARQSFLAKASSILNSCLEYEVTLTNLVNLIVPAIASWCSIDLVEENGSLKCLAASAMDSIGTTAPPEPKFRPPPDLRNSPGLYSVIRSGHAELSSEITDEFLEDYVCDTRHLPTIRQLGIASAMIVPLVACNRTLGTMTLLQSASGPSYDRDDLAFAEELGLRTGVAVDNARLYMEAQRLNAELEHRVQQRTGQLEETNKELESFTYSVAHDLRAPLRAIDGFTRVLLEDHAAQLDKNGKQFLTYTRTSTKKMGKLIDDLLAFSRISRKELEELSTINMRELAQELVDDVLKREANQSIVIRVGDLPSIRGSAPMLRLVLNNLLSNAIKFTRSRSEPIIEIGTEGRENEYVFYVRDNGVGFNMRYANKLFGVFQRLHSSENYEGTGVGLAIVQRIIHRHGGRVWAEGEVNKGATFYFTMPKTEEQR